MIEQEKLQEFCNETFWEFEHFCDYIWKFNLQIDELKSRELEKLQAYFPNNSNRKAMRWHLESQKLDELFPLALNYSFIVLVFISIETRLMKTCDILTEVKGCLFGLKI